MRCVCRLERARCGARASQLSIETDGEAELVQLTQLDDSREGSCCVG
jgi:hypothetical protein